MNRTAAIIAMAAWLVLAGCAAKGPPEKVKVDDIKGDPYYDFLRADVLSLEGETKKSTRELGKLIRDNPDEAYYHYLMSQNFAQEGRLTEAVASCVRAVQLAPGIVDFRMFLGKLYASQDMNRDAEKVFLTVIRDEPAREEAYLQLARAYIGQKEYYKAIGAMHKLLRVNPDSAIAYYYIGSIYEQHLKQPDRALQAFRQALEIEPGNIIVHNAIAEIYLEKKDLRKALAKYEEIAHIDPDDITTHLRIALIQYELKEYDKAIESFERIIYDNPDADKIRYYLGVLYEGVERYDRALEQFAQVPPNSSYYKDARLHMAAIYREQGRVEDSVSVLREAMKGKPQVSAFYEYAAALLEEQKDYEEAIRIVKMGRDALPDDERLAFFLALLYERVGDRDNAIAAMRDVLEINPQNAGALNYIGYTQAERGEKLDESLEMIEKALILRPDDGYVIDSLGWVYFRRGDNETALQHLNKASRLVPGEPTILYHIGEVLLEMGREKEALGYFERALKAGEKSEDEGDVEELEKIRTRIEQLRNR